jgi:hypothetical protein
MAVAVEGFGFFKIAGEDGVFLAFLKNGIEIPHSPNDNTFWGKHCSWLYFKAMVKCQNHIYSEPGHTSYESAKSYRPIILTSFFLKTLERQVDQYHKNWANQILTHYTTHSMLFRGQNLAKLRSKTWSAGLKQRLIVRYMLLEHFWILKEISTIPLFEQ